MKSSMRTVVVMALLSASVVAGGCSSAAGPDPAKLEGTWALESFGAETELVPADPAVTTTLTMKDGESSGTGGVNSFSGTYKSSDDGGITFGPQAATAMAGPPAASEQEMKFFKALEDVENFEFTDGKLVFTDLGNNTLMVLGAQ